MYPTEELDRLNLRKQLLLLRSDRLRLECTLAARQLTPPLALIDSGARIARKLSPLMALTPLLLSGRKMARGVGLMGLAVKWGPAIFRTWKSFRGSLRDP